MTQPPEEEQPRTPAGEPEPTYAGAPLQRPDDTKPYPRQELLPQEIKPGRSRLPLIIGLVAVLVLVGGGLGAWLLLRDDGEDTRAAYCDALRELTNDGDLMGAVSGGGDDLLGQASEVRDLAPDAVAGEWDSLFDLVEQGTSGEPDMSQMFAAANDLQVIARDAESKCDIALNIPFGPTGP